MNRPIQVKPADSESRTSKYMKLTSMHIDVSCRLTLFIEHVGGLYVVNCVQYLNSLLNILE